MKTLLILVLFLYSAGIYGQEQKFYFYNPQNDFGSDKLFNPLSLLVNGSFDILRNGGHTKNVFDLPFGNGFRNVNLNLTDPFTSIRAYGWKRFIEQEVFNLELNKDKANFLPNLADHTIGNGMQYAKLAEWFEYNKYPYPKLYSLMITFAYQYMNEVIENNLQKGPNIDPIADMYIFNVLGYVLFGMDGVKRFFSEDLPTYEWSLQPMFNLNNDYLENTGQQYIIRKELPFINKNLAAFFYWGLTGIGGISYKYNEIHNFSIGIGQIANKINDRYSEGLRFFSPELDGAVSFFYDKNNSLMFSVLYTGPKMPNLRINVYPGLFNVKGFEPGIYMGIGKWDNFLIGINLIHNIPVSPAYGRSIH